MWQQGGTPHLRCWTMPRFEKVFDRMGKEDEQFKAYFTDGEVGGRNIPTKDDWDKCRVFLQFLSLFYKATLKFSGSLYVTSSTSYREMLVIQTKIKEHMAITLLFWLQWQRI